MLYPSIWVSISFLSLVHANDWSIPCFDGVCEYSPPSGASSGTLKIWGSSDAISDITAAAGWEIIGCNPDLLVQDIRLVCIGGDGCDHLYQKSGAEGKLVRLPENCGRSAFARVGRAWIPDDQSLPSSVSKRLAGRDDIKPQVKALSLDSNFSAIDTSRFGAVNFSIHGSNTPSDSSSSSAVVTHWSLLHRRADSSLFSNDFNFTNTTIPQPIDVDQPFNLFNQSVNCGPIQGTFSIDVDAKVHAEIPITVAVVGTIAPPALDQFQMIIGLTADITGTIGVKADLVGTLDTGKIPIVPQIGIPGLDFPGILAIGPFFEVDAEATSTLDIGAAITVGLNYHVANAKIAFPSSETETLDFTVGDTPLSLSATPDVSSKATLSAHIIPSLDIGISALDDLVKTTVSINFDASASLILSLQAQSAHSIPVKRSIDPPASLVARKDAQKGVTVTALGPTATSARINPTCVCVLTTIQSSATPTATAGATSAETKTASASISSETGTIGSTNVNFGGCIDLQIGLDVSVSANADFFAFFQKGASLSLFSKTFDLFKKCFGAAPSKRSSWARRSARERRPENPSANRRDGPLACPLPGLKAPTTVTDQTVTGSSIAPITR
ncbi:hypothetical protein C8J56DRAFT_1173048 [Mycena floridula]|nr:hypothetical protein C8J56DRAFT_1173048 [Mycena floridula]